MITRHFKKLTFGKVLYHFCILSLLGLFFVSLVSQPEPARTESEFILKTKDHWVNLKKNHFISGSILIVKNNQPIFSDGDQNQRFMIGSLSKSFVGYYFYKNKHHLESKICIYIKKFCNTPLSQISIENLLQHKNGFNTFFEFRHTFYKNFKLSDLDDLDISAEDFDSEKFKKLNYSNLGYDILSRIIELIEKKSFSIVVNDIAKEAGLTSTSLIQKADSLSLNVTLPYIACCIRLPFINMNEKTYGSGGIISTPQDLLTWIQFLKLKEVSNELTQESDKNTTYNYGLVKTTNSFDSVTWHNGAILGYRSLMLTTDKNLQIIILTQHIKPFKFFEDQLSVFENLFKPTKKEQK